MVDWIANGESGASVRAKLNTQVRLKLTANTTWYVRTDGSNSNTGLANTAGGAFLTIQKAVDTVCQTIDLAGYVATIQVADGTYAEEILLSDYVGEGKVIVTGPEKEDLAVELIGNETTPTNVILTGTNPSSQFRVLRIANSKEWFVSGFSFAPVHFQDAIECHYSTLRLGVIDFGAGTGGYGIWCPSRSNITIEEGGKISWSGNGWSNFVSIYDGAWMRCWEHTTINFNSDVDFGVFVDIGEGSALHLQRLDALNLNGHTVTGWKFDLWNGGSLRVDKNVGGDVNPFDLPGSTPGVVLDYGWYNGVLLHGNRTWTAGAHVVTTDYTLVFDDGDTTIYVNSASAKTITLPRTFTQSWSCKVVQEGAGAVNFSAAAGGTVQGATGLTTQYSAAILEVKANADDLSAAWRITTEPVSAGGGSGTPGGSDTQIQYNNAGAFGGALLRYSAANLFLGDVDAASPVAQTLSPQNVATGTSNTAGADFTISGSRSTGNAQGGSLIFKTSDVGSSGTGQNTLTTAMTITAGRPGVGGTRLLSFDSTVQVQIGLLAFINGASVLNYNSTNSLVLTSSSSQQGIFSTYNSGTEAIGFLSGNYNNSADTVFTRNAAAVMQMGFKDAAAPVAQTLTVQSVVAGTSNTAGADFTISGSKGTGTGAGGSIVFKTAAAGSTGTAQNALATALTIDSKKQLTLPGIWNGTDLNILFSNNCGFGSVNSEIRVTRTGFDYFSLDTGAGQLVVRGGGSSYGGSVAFGTPGGTIDCQITGTAANTIQLGLADAASPVAQTLTVQSVVAGTTDTAGVAWTFIGSKGTGTAASGNIIDKTGFSAKSTGTSQHTTVDRKVIVAKGKVLTSGAAASLFEVALPTLSMCGGQIEATVVCTNGTDMQSFTQTISYSAVNKGGVYTSSITASTGDKSVSGGSTLTNAWSILTGTNKITIQLTPTTSLTPSTNAFLVYYTVKNNSEQATTIL